MKILGLDLGSKTLGIAMSDPLGIIAQGIKTFTFKTAHYQHAICHLTKIVETENITTVVLGLPLNTNNTEGERAKITRRFAKKLEVATAVKVVLWDERFTSLQANRILIDGGVCQANRKKHIDQLAATIILQSYLDRNRHLNS